MSESSDSGRELIQQRNDLVRSWCDLPGEILSLIISHLLVGDSFAFRGVCKWWNETPSPTTISIMSTEQPFLLLPSNKSNLSRRAMTTSKEKFTFPTQITQSNPWIVMCGGEKNKLQTFISLKEGQYYTKIIPELENKRITSFCMEWLVLNDYGNDECTLLNVITMEKIELPKFHLDQFHSSCKLTLTPEDPQCQVVFIDHYPLRIFTCQPGDDKFIKRNMELLNIDNPVILAFCFEGAIYGLAASFSLVKAKLNNPTLEFQIIINGESMRDEILDDLHTPYLTESCGELLMVTMSTLHIEPWAFYVFRADFPTLEWVKLRHIGDRAIFIDPFSSHCISCASLQYGIQGNCIYFIQEGDRSLYIFNLDDDSLTMTVPCPTLSRINMVPHWLMITPSKVSFNYFRQS